MLLLAILVYAWTVVKKEEHRIIAFLRGTALMVHYLPLHDATRLRFGEVQEENSAHF